MMLPMLMAGTPTWIFLSERAWAETIEGTAHAPMIKTANSNRFEFMNEPPSVKPSFPAFSPALGALSMRLSGVDKRPRIEISQGHHVTQYTQGKFVGAVPTDVCHPPF
jgi:hypothetical protein